MNLYFLLFLPLNASSPSRLLAEFFLDLSPLPYKVCKKSTSSLFLLLFLMFALFPNRVISLPLFPLVLIGLFYVKPPLILPFGRQASLTPDCRLDYRHPKYIWLLRVELSVSIIKSPLGPYIRDLAYSLLSALPHLYASIKFRPNSHKNCKEWSLIPIHLRLNLAYKSYFLDSPK